MTFRPIIQIAYWLLLAFIICFDAWLIITYYHLWRKTITLLGFQTTLKISMLRLRLRLQGSLFEIVVDATPIGFIAIIVLSVWLFYQWDMHSINLWLCALVFIAPFMVIVLMVQLLPPSVIFLASSNASSMQLLDILRSRTWVDVVSFLDEFALTPVSNLRTRHDHWESPVLNMIDQIPLVFLDTREITSPLIHELTWLIQPERVYKTVFVIGNDGRSPLLECWRTDWLKFSDTLIHVQARNAREMLLALTASRESLPRLPAYDDSSARDLMAAAKALQERDVQLPKRITRRRHTMWRICLIIAPIAVGTIFLGKTGFVLGIFAAILIVYAADAYSDRKRRKQ